jgi:hypothetical protein
MCNREHAERKFYETGWEKDRVRYKYNQEFKPDGISYSLGVQTFSGFTSTRI